MSPRLTTAAALLVTLAWANGARAEKDACITAYEDTQTQRKDGKLIDARREAATCARAECPALLAKDCSRWRAELDAAIPSVVLEARSPDQGELVDVRVTIDGALATEKLDGKAISLDPGTRRVRFEAGRAVAERVVVVREGEKNRKVSVVLVEESQAPAATSPRRPVPVGVWIFGGAAVAALATSAVFALDGLSRKSDLEACKPQCSAAQVDAMSARFTMADVALGAGAMAGLAAAWLFVTRPEARPERSRGATWVVPLRDGVATGVTGRF